MTQGENDAATVSPFWIKLAIQGGVALAILGTLSFGGFRYYRHWQPARLARQAHDFIAKGDTANASIALRRALEINPLSEEAAREMVVLMEKLQRPEALGWRERVAGIHPGASDDALAWAATAIRQGESVPARRALDSVEENSRQTAPYHALAGVTAIAEGRVGEARKHFSEALKLDPTNDLHRYNFAVLQLQSPDVATRGAGRQTLSELAKSGRLQLNARRTLIKELMLEKSWEEARRLSAEQLAAPGAEFADRIAHLDLLSQAQSPALAAFLAETQQATRAGKPEQIAALATWMRFGGSAADALKWIASLDPKTAAHQRIGAARAECLIVTGDWPGLLTLVEPGQWADLEYTRLAYFSRALRELNDAGQSRVRWEAAIAAAKSRDQSSQLALLAARWGWEFELRDTLWASTRQPAPGWALQMLHRYYLGAGNTDGLLRVAARFAEIDPQSATAHNNVAMLSLLLRRDLPTATVTARELHAKEPANPVFASTHAYALHLADRSAEGLKVLQALRPEKLREPSIALYHSILLVATGAKADAQPFLDLAKAAPLLPEEKSLLAEAQKSSAL